MSEAVSGAQLEFAHRTRPYFLRALHAWCSDSGLTPYLEVFVDDTVTVPREFVREHLIVLNISWEATQGLEMRDDAIRFQARFGGRPFEVHVPTDHVIGLYAQETGQGMAFPVPLPQDLVQAPSDDSPEPPSPPRGPALKRVK